MSKETIKISINKITNEELMRLACSFTINKESKMPLSRIYQCMHSPIRTQMFFIEMYNIPTFCSVHLVRHGVGAVHFVKSNREDRMGYSGDEGRWQPVNHGIFLNAEEIINICRKRMCGKTHKATTAIVNMWKNEMEKVDPDLVPFMVRECEFRGGICPELKSCGNLYVPKDKLVTISMEDCHYESETGSYYSCSKCGEPNLMEIFKFCPGCGAKINWQVKE